MQYRFRRWFGHSAQEIIGKPFWPLAPLEDRTFIREYPARFQTGVRVLRDLEAVRIRKDCCLVDVSVSVSRRPGQRNRGSRHRSRYY